MLRRIRQIMHAEDIAILPPSASVYAAAAVMKRQRQCGVLVMTRAPGRHPDRAGVVRRVVAEQRDPGTVTLADVMTRNPDTITPDDLALTGLQMMEDGCYGTCRFEKGRVIGLISRADFPGEERTELEPNAIAGKGSGNAGGTRFRCRAGTSDERQDRLYFFVMQTRSGWMVRAMMPSMARTAAPDSPG